MHRPRAQDKSYRQFTLRRSTLPGNKSVHKPEVIDKRNVNPSRRGGGEIVSIMGRYCVITVIWFRSRGRGKPGLAVAPSLHNGEFGSPARPKQHWFTALSTISQTHWAQPAWLSFFIIKFNFHSSNRIHWTKINLKINEDNSKRQVLSHTSTWGGGALGQSFTDYGRLARWIKWRACDVGEAKEGLENALWRRWSDGRVGEWLIT